MIPKGHVYDEFKKIILRKYHKTEANKKDNKKSKTQRVRSKKA